MSDRHWEVCACAYQTKSDGESLAELLRDGWEPFAVTEPEYGFRVYHLRRFS
jgi:hypothetical protein